MTSTATGRRTKPKTTTRPPLAVDLALQGGGAHGAFSWGVLDRVLEEDWIEINGISGTSAGAMNAAVMAAAFASGGRQAAREGLETFWRKVSDAARFSPFQRGPLDILMGRWTLDTSPMFVAMDLMSRLVSPYDLNPSGNNPLRDILAETVDFAALAGGSIKVFVTATNVRTGRGRVFRNAELSPDVLLASACLPTLFQAITIDGDDYWDGGYSGNPTMTPLIRESDALDTILVQINPIERPGTPRTARDILNRLNEVSFNAVLLKELRMMALLRRTADAGAGEGARWAGMRVHRIASDMMVDLGYSSKLNAEWDFLTMLRDEGRRAARSLLSRPRRQARTRVLAGSRHLPRGRVSRAGLKRSVGCARRHRGSRRRRRHGHGERRLRAGRLRALRHRPPVAAPEAVAAVAAPGAGAPHLRPADRRRIRGVRLAHRLGLRPGRPLDRHRTGRFQAIYDQVALWLEGHGIVVSGVWSDHFNTRWLLSAVQTLTSRVNSAMSFWVVVLVYVILGLLEVGDFARRAAAIGDEDLRRVLVRGTAETAKKLRRYMLVRTQMSLLTGLLVWAFARAIGLDLAGEWGVIAFTLNYVPFIGPLIATVFPRHSHSSSSSRGSGRCSCWRRSTPSSSWWVATWSRVFPGTPWPFRRRSCCSPCSSGRSSGASSAR